MTRAARRTAADIKASLEYLAIVARDIGCCELAHFIDVAALAASEIVSEDAGAETRPTMH